MLGVTSKRWAVVRTYVGRMLGITSHCWAVRRTYVRCDLQLLGGETYL